MVYAHNLGRTRPIRPPPYFSLPPSLHCFQNVLEEEEEAFFPFFLDTGLKPLRRERGRGAFFVFFPLFLLFQLILGGGGRGLFLFSSSSLGKRDKGKAAVAEGKASQEIHWGRMAAATAQSSQTNEVEGRGRGGSFRTNGGGEWLRRCIKGWPSTRERKS